MSSLQRPPAADFDDAAARLLGAITGITAATVPFPLRLEAALKAACDVLQTTPLLARRVTVTARGDAELAARLDSWAQTYGDVLREAVRVDRHFVAPRPFLEPHLIAGCAAQIRLELRRSEPDLRSVAGPLHAFILSYYLDASEITSYYNAFGADAP